MSHDLKISANAKKFDIRGGSKLEVFDESGKLIHKGEFKSFTSNFLKLLYGSMVGAGTVKAKDLGGNNIEMDSYPQCMMNMGGGSGNYRFGVVVGTGDSAVGVNDYALVSPATGLNYNDTVIGSPSVGSTSVSVEISRQIGNTTGSTVALKEAGLICGVDVGTTGNTLIARDLFSITLENGKKSTWRYTVNFNFTAENGGFVKGLANNFAKLFIETTASAAWAGRYGFGCVVHDGKMWVIGGNTGSTNANDVWYSSDGITWTQATSSAPWARRYYHDAVVHDGKIWVIGGASSSERLNDVWYSSDGITWTQATSSAPWAGRSGFGCVVHDGKIWVMGGASSSGRLNDVWYSSDGITWTQATSSAPWTQRDNFGCVVHDGKIWVIGGVSSSGQLNDVWYSPHDTTIIIPGSSDSAFSATAIALGSLIADGAGSGQLVYGNMPDASTEEPYVEGNKTRFSLAREFSNSSGADITIREVGLFSGSTMLARLILANPITLADGESEIVTVDFETEV